jgi:hypothetical protein
VTPLAKLVSNTANQLATFAHYPILHCTEQRNPFFLRKEAVYKTCLLRRQSYQLESTVLLFCFRELEEENNFRQERNGSLRPSFDLPHKFPGPRSAPSWNLELEEVRITQNSFVKRFSSRKRSVRWSLIDHRYYRYQTCCIHIIQRLSRQFHPEIMEKST